MNKLKFKITKEWTEYKLLMRNIPSISMTMFVLSVVLMNLLANKELLNVGWLALDCGFCLSWLSFLSMDMITRRFGAKASIEVSITAVVINLMASLILFLISLTPGNWGVFYDTEDVIVNSALNSTIGSTWYVVLGSMTAFVVSSIVNALLNEGIGKLCKSKSFGSFAVRSYVSTMIGQFVDNLIFASMVSYVFFGWSLVQVITCSFAGAVMELLSEIIFSPIGYRVCKKWEKEKIGEMYLIEENRVEGEIV